MSVRIRIQEILSFSVASQDESFVSIAVTMLRANFANCNVTRLPKGMAINVTFSVYYE